MPKEVERTGTSKESQVKKVTIEKSVKKQPNFVLKRQCKVILFCCFASKFNSYGNGGTVSSPNHTFPWASLNKQLTSTSSTYFPL